MTWTRNRHGATALVLLAGIGMLTWACDTESPRDPLTAGLSARLPMTIPVSGEAIHFFTTQVTHSESPVDGGIIARTTDIIRLSGDVNGYILYHPTTEIDFSTQTLVNTGVQFFSGTIDGSEPLVLYDETFRFEVDLTTGETLGQVHLGRSQASPHPGRWWECDLEVVGTGMTPEGDGLATYNGSCTRFGRGSRGP
jgi:hypothetical protein